MQSNTIVSVPLAKVALRDGFWAARTEANRTVTLPIEYQQLQQTGPIDAWKLDWQPGMPNKPHRFWDSDVAKWIEAAAYSLATHPDAELEAQVDDVIELIAAAQQSDGYLNIYYTTVEPENRWANLRDWHELYCAGHLIEAAVAYVEATGKDKFLRVMIRYADYIDEVFGPAAGQLRGYPGHQEVELALVKLYRITGEQRYLTLAKFFIDERGQQPHYYDTEAQKLTARGLTGGGLNSDHSYVQAHLPVRAQDVAVGHAVRACYMYAGMTDIAAATGDQILTDACKRLWRNLTEKQMYITGGIGPAAANEGFSFDYDLPDESAYAETCAAIALVFWASRMVHLEPDSCYADVMERALYNGVLAGVSRDGAQFFYANPLAAHPNVNPNSQWSAALSFGTATNDHYRRSDWFDCACCPPNIARLLASLGQYIYSTRVDAGEEEVYVHLYAGSSAAIELNGRAVTIAQQTKYPWDERVTLTVSPRQPISFTLALRIPDWCARATLHLNGDGLDLASITTKGYARISRTWRAGDTVELTLAMPVQRIETNPNVRQNAGRVALQRGPVVYCLEEVDNGPNLADVALSRDAELAVSFEKELLGGVPLITGDATRRNPEPWTGALYRPAKSALVDFSMSAIPYFLWANRVPGEMRVWIQRAQ